MGYKTVYEGGSGEIIEKKSRFIATIIPASTEDEALCFIEQMKKKYWDASHNCFAFIIGKDNELERCSDDGEPQKTAGRPMLDVLINEGLNDIAVVVTRYFGGTLLGTGGLVRAYQKAVKKGLDNCRIIEKIPARKVTVITDYNGIGKLQYIAAKEDILFLDTQYTDIVKAVLLITNDKFESFSKRVKEATNGKAVIEEGDSIYYSFSNKELLLF